MSISFKLNGYISRAPDMMALARSSLKMHEHYNFVFLFFFIKCLEKYYFLCIYLFFYYLNANSKDTPSRRIQTFPSMARANKYPK